MTFDERIAGLVNLPESLTSAFVRRRPAMVSHSDELSIAATDALVEAVRKFDAKRGKSLTEFAAICVNKRLNWTMTNILIRSKSLNSQGFTTSSNYDAADTRRSVITLPDDYYLRLTRHQIRVICLRFEGGYTFSQIARKCKCSKVNAFKIYRRGLKRINVYMSTVT